MSLDGAGFFLRETPVYIQCPCDGGRELEPEQSLQILVSLLQLQALMMALAKQMHVAVEMFATQQRSFGQETSAGLGDEVTKQYTDPKPPEKNQVNPITPIRGPGGGEAERLSALPTPRRR